ncbi:hypothetical protein Tcan_17193 [Toxocara canis]|uniref:Nucleotide-diphospho-sugar transferase domain-containing protein n=1 Tax=Toxocara canis TaxID=6265 RepID=A0A0B2V9F4_TOXCA|nr:hypothetical protein Tcan_17193 [Toxocara canis]
MVKPPVSSPHSYRDFKRGDWVTANAMLSSIDWNTHFLECSDTEEIYAHFSKLLNVSNEEFLKVARTMSDTEPTLIFIFNQYAFNMTMNWLCNTISMRDVHARTVLVTLDRVSYDNIGLIWPNITRFYWNRPFNYGDGYYHLFFLFRSNLAQAFLKLGKPFWMAQQDTFWRKSIFDLKLDDAQKEADIIFDKASDSALPLIAGRSFITKWPYERGHYKVRPTCGSRTFFKQLSADLEHQYAPDNTYMSALCAHLAIINCEFIPFQKIANWMWLYEQSTQLAEVPYLLQFDGERKLGGKLAAMKELGFYFLNKDALTCNASAVSVGIRF